MKYYIDVEQEKPFELPAADPDPSWPAVAAVEFVGVMERTSAIAAFPCVFFHCLSVPITVPASLQVSARYRPGLPLVCRRTWDPRVPCPFCRNLPKLPECGKTVQTPAAIDRCRAARRAIGAVERRRSGVSWDLGPSRPLRIAPQPSQTFSPESA